MPGASAHASQAGVILLPSRPASPTGHRPSQEPTHFEVQGLYGRSSGFWDTVDTIKGGARTLQEISDLLESQYRSPIEGLIRLDLRFESPAKEPLDSLFTHGFFGAGFDYLAGGYARDRIFPELRGYSVYTAHVDYGYRTLPEPRESGFDLLLLTSLGAGNQYLAQGPAVDFIEKVPAREAAVFYWGLDLSVGYTAYFSDDFRSRHRLLLRPTLFHSDLTDSGYQYEITEDRITPRWRWENEWTISTASPLSGGAEMSVLAISGQQPVPVDVLPRTWDSIHEIKINPAVGQLVGLGTAFSLFSEGRTFDLKLVGGFFGGYFGADVRAKLGFLALRAGTFGLEQTGGYRIQESRIKYVSAGISYAF